MPASINTPLIESLLVPQMFIFGCVFLRFTGLLLALPVFSEYLPVRVRMVFQFFLSVFVLQTLDNQPTINPTLPNLFLTGVSEFMLGLVLGLFVQILLSIYMSAGQLVGMHIGLGFAGFIDPQFQEETMSTTRLVIAMSMLAFVSAGGLLHLFSGLCLSFRVLPLGRFVFSEHTGLTLYEPLLQSFKMGVVLAMPVIAAILIMQGLLGMMSRAVSEFNTLYLSFSFLLIVGIVVFVGSIPDMMKMAFDLGQGLTDRLIGFARALS